MNFEDLYGAPLERSTLLRRYKRFLADVRLPDGGITTLHCPNTGSMKNCAEEGFEAWYSRSTNPARKYPFTWELSGTLEGHLIGVNTGFANRLIDEALGAGAIPRLAGYAARRREVAYGTERSRIDFLLEGHESDRRNCFVEVKSVTLLEEPAADGVGFFPDAVSVRGQKHLRELLAVVEAGDRAVLCFCVQHTGIREVRPADHIDPAYGALLRSALSGGVEVIACGTVITPREITVSHEIPTVIP